MLYGPRGIEEKRSVTPHVLNALLIAHELDNLSTAALHEGIVHLKL